MASVALEVGQSEVSVVLARFEHGIEALPDLTLKAQEKCQIEYEPARIDLSELRLSPS